MEAGSEGSDGGSGTTTDSSSWASLADESAPLQTDPIPHSLSSQELTRRTASTLRTNGEPHPSLKFAQGEASFSALPWSRSLCGLLASLTCAVSNYQGADFHVQALISSSSSSSPPPFLSVNLPLLPQSHSSQPQSACPTSREQLIVLLAIEHQLGGPHEQEERDRCPAPPDFGLVEQEEMRVDGDEDSTAVGEKNCCESGGLRLHMSEGTRKEGQQPD
jgi:hypothetical protein